MNKVNTLGLTDSLTATHLTSRRVAFADLMPCYNAFIDTRSPGSSKKENFTIIGPGVSENPLQHVHIAQPHGFNIGGARQPPKCTNSQHSHETAELFVVHSGTWSFNLGENGDMARVVLNAGDVISIPTQVFRGFENIGQDTGFLWAVLGGDDPGKVTWAPYVFDMAKDYGLVLLEDGTLIDTKAGQAVPQGAKIMPRTTKEQVNSMRHMTSEDLEAIVVRQASMASANVAKVVGEKAPLDWPHGFTLDRHRLVAEVAQTLGVEPKASVLFVHEGQIVLEIDGISLKLGTGDTFSVPPQALARLLAREQATVFRVCSA
jgi:quercetin dioxygenase-like cupin family protein